MKAFKVLIADDQYDNVRTLAGYLSESNQKFEVLTVPNGLAAIHVTKDELPDLVLLDWDMPVLNGPNALRAIRSCPETAQIPVILVTGHMVKSEHLAEALDNGANDYMRKPVEKIEFMARVRAAIALSEAQKTIANQQHQLLLFHQSEKERLEVDNVKKTVEIKKLAEMLASKNEELELTLSNFKEVVEEGGSERILKIKELLDREKHRKPDWIYLQGQLETVYPGMLGRLAKQLPQLSTTEFRMAVFLLIGLETKEIGLLQNITNDGVYKSKYRLRKSLGVADDESLVSAIRALAWQR